jgi:hypothetical protein
MQCTPNLGEDTRLVVSLYKPSRRKLVTSRPSDLESPHGNLERDVSALRENIPPFNDRRHVAKLFLVGKATDSQRGTIARLHELRQGIRL